MKNLLPLLLLTLLFAACETDPYVYEASTFVELKKDPCFGACPVYAFKIDGKGNATFNGLRFVGKEGDWHQKFSPEVTNELFKTFEAADFWQFEDEYTATVTDLPTTWLTLQLGEKSKTIKDYFGAPPELKELEAKVEAIAETDDGWVKTNENPGQ